MWMGGNGPRLATTPNERTLVINPARGPRTVRRVFALYRGASGCVPGRVKEEADRPRASDEMQHDNEWHRARGRQTLLARVISTHCSLENPIYTGHNSSQG